MTGRVEIGSVVATDVPEPAREALQAIAAHGAPAIITFDRAVAAARERARYLSGCVNGDLRGPYRMKFEARDCEAFVTTLQQAQIEVRHALDAPTPDDINPSVLVRVVLFTE